MMHLGRVTFIGQYPTSDHYGACDYGCY